MAFLDRADLVTRVKLRLNRPATDEAMTATTADDVIYDALTAEQGALIRQLAACCPSAMMTAPTLLVTADSGLTYTFGTALTYPTGFGNVVPIGHFHLYAALQHIPDLPLLPGVDFAVEGPLIRIPNGRARVFPDGAPYGQWTAIAAAIDASTEPTLPMLFRPTLVSGACARVAKFRLGMDASVYDAQRDADWTDALTVAQTQAAGMGGLPLYRRSATSLLRGYSGRG